MIRTAQRLLPLVTLVAIGLVCVDPLRRSDLMVFLRAAHDVLHGVNPYTPTDDPFLWGGSAYVYPYLTAFLFIPFTLVPVPVADVAWFALCAGGMIYGCRTLGLRDPVAISALLLSSTCIRSFQVGAINTLLFLAAAVLWKHRERAAVVAVAFTFLTGSKLFLLPVAVWLVLTRSRRVVLVAGGSLAAFLGLSLLLMPISTSQFLRSMSLLAEHEGTHGMSLARLLSYVVPGSTARLLAVALGGAVLAAGVAYRFRRPAYGDPVLFAACLVASLLATPVYWSHYTILAAVVLLIVSPTRRTAVLFAVASWVVSRPDHGWSALQLPVPARLVLLFGGLVAAVVAVGVMRRPSPVGSSSLLPVMSEVPVS
jgi:alpha-1,2-mannosyltransferase